MTIGTATAVERPCREVEPTVYVPAVGLLTARLFFVERDGDDVRVDVVVLARADTPSSPPVGEPLCFMFALPGDADRRDAIERVLRAWADSMRVVDFDICRHHGKALARLAVAEASMTLEPADRCP